VANPKSFGIRVEGLKQFHAAVKKLQDDKEGEDALRKANVRTANLVVGMARREASSKIERKAAATLTASKSASAVKVIGGDANVPYFGGANFGSYRNKTRLIKAPIVRDDGRRIAQKRTRATMVRRSRDIDKVVRRIERQYVDTRGRTIGKREGGQQVRVARTKSGAIRKIRGWNQFRRWRRGKDYFLYQAINKHERKIINFYAVALDDALREAFPD
jgi:hypothetical protein